MENHGLIVDPNDIRVQKMNAFVTAVAPALAKDGGSMEFLGIHPVTGNAHITMKGACVDCSSSAENTLEGLKRLLARKVQEVPDLVDDTIRLGELRDFSDGSWTPDLARTLDKAV